LHKYVTDYITFLHLTDILTFGAVEDVKTSLKSLF